MPYPFRETTEIRPNLARLKELAPNISFYKLSSVELDELEQALAKFKLVKSQPKQVSSAKTA